MDISIRKATVYDAREIAHIHVVAWKAAYRDIVPQSFLDALDVNSRAELWSTWLQNEDAHIYVATVDGQIRGFIGGGKLREAIGESIGEYDAELYAIYLLPSVKGQGIGKLLVRELAKLLDTRGFRRMAVWVLAENPACGFYEHLGAQRIAQKQIQIGDASLLEVAYEWQDLQRLAMSA
jgi:GNAT superfamily N-acetyltransferase